MFGERGGLQGKVGHRHLEDVSFNISDGTRTYT
jgi:hypothetical protein